jgi:hypothetical protein
MSTTLTIGLTLLGFLVGFVIAAFFSQSRVRNLEAGHAARLDALQADLDKRTEELAAARTSLEAEQSERRSDLEAAQVEATDLTAQLNIVRAQLEEFQADAGEMEDRLNAAEARILSDEAAIAQSRTDISQWSGAYAQLKETHGRLSAENREIQTRRRRLEEELAERHAEMEALRVRLEALQSAQTLPATLGGGDAQQTVAAISLARADADAALRRREAELSDVRSRLSAMRYSINVLTAAGAELAAEVASQNVIDLDPDELLPETSPFTPVAPAFGTSLSAGAAHEELADLHGVIADWFAAMRNALPYDAATLRAFGGQSAARRLDVAPPAINALLEQPADAATAPAEIPPNMEEADDAIPPTVMLAAIKAVTTSRMDRAAARQVELARELADRQRDLDQLTERIHAWRTMLAVTLAREPELLSLLDEPRETSTGDLLSACATVALTAYQKKQVAQIELRSVERRPAEATEGALPDEPRKVAPEGSQERALRDWRPVRRARK